MQVSGDGEGEGLMLIGVRMYSLGVRLARIGDGDRVGRVGERSLLTGVRHMCWGWRVSWLDFGRRLGVNRHVGQNWRREVGGSGS